MTLRAALATYGRIPDLTDDDRPLIPALAACGIAARPARWDDPAERWEEYDAVVIRSTWDYHLRTTRFEAWLERLASAPVVAVNPVSVVRWNMHKRYLRELASGGVAIPETLWLAAGEGRSLDAIFRDTGWTRAIVKPSISASATDTWSVEATEREALEPRFRELTGRADVMVQRYLPEVESRGEWSVVFIDGQVSHSGIKRPRQGDFRVQREFGGTVAFAEPPASVLRAAGAIAESLPAEWLFARIDGIQTGGGFVLMEVECIEPDLFFRLRPASRDRFAAAVQGRLAD